MALSEQKKKQMKSYYLQNREKIKEYHKRYRELNKEKIIAKQMEWYSENKTVADEYHKEWRKNNRDRINARNRKRRLEDSVKAQEAEYRKKNESKIKTYMKDYNIKNRESLNKQARIRFKNRIKEDINFRLMVMCRSRLRTAIKSSGGKKAGKTTHLLGCTSQELKTYLQGLFKEGMYWDNYGHGRGKWNVDHIIPCSSFDLTDPEQQKKCFHHTNLQPLWAEENWAKHDKMPDPDTHQGTIPTPPSAS